MVSKLGSSGVMGLGAGLLVACAVGVTPPFGDSSGPASGDGGGGFRDDAGNVVAGGASLIYAHSDTELFSMDPSTQSIVDIGPFDDGSGSMPAITDLAVNAAGEVWVNSESAIYKATVPSTPGTVSLQKVTDVSVASSQKFYALGFAPAGVLGATETLVAGDNQGELYAVQTTGATVDLGSFGTDASGNAYQLSGDVMFYLQAGKARGLATVRSCKKSTCSGSNDILAEIDVTAMQTAYQTGTPGVLKKQFLGSGTGFGHLYGVGAWNDNVYAFARTSSGSPAELVQIGPTGKGTVLKTFPDITAGWSGAGVTTSAVVTVLPPN